MFIRIFSMVVLLVSFTATSGTNSVQTYALICLAPGVTNFVCNQEISLNLVLCNNSTNMIELDSGSHPSKQDSERCAIEQDGVYYYLLSQVHLDFLKKGQAIHQVVKPFPFSGFIPEGTGCGCRVPATLPSEPGLYDLRITFKHHGKNALLQSNGMFPGPVKDYEKINVEMLGTFWIKNIKVENPVSESSANRPTPAKH